MEAMTASLPPAVVSWLSLPGGEHLLARRISPHDEENRRRVLITAGASVALLALAAFFAVYTALAGLPRSLSIFCWLGCVVFGCNLPFLRWLGITKTATLLCAELVVLLFVTAATGGGLQVLAGPWNIFIPLLAAYLIGLRGSVFCGAAILLECGVFYWLEKSGQLPPGPQLEAGTLLASSFAALCLVTMGLFYEAAHRSNRSALVRQTDLYEAVLRTQADIGEGLIMLDGSTPAEWRQPVLLNTAIAKIFGYAQEELAAIPSIFDLIVPEESQDLLYRLTRAVSSGAPVEASALRKDGQRIRIEIAAKGYSTGGRSGIVALIRDVTERSQARIELEQRALFDGLTGLANRTLFMDRLRHALLTSDRSQTATALLLMDLDRFKEVNDTLGHAAGDHLLRELARKLPPLFRQSDTVARLGGDEFAFILPKADASRAVAITERIRRLLHEPIVIEGRSLEVGASIGIAVFPDHGREPDVLLRHADVAMYAAKREATGYAVYEEGRDQNRASLLTMTTELRHAIEQGKLLLHYQPQIDLETGQIIGIEALARWPLPDGGMRPPGDFIPLAESTGLIRPLLSWALGAALRDLKTLRAAGCDIPVSVNLSMRNLQDPELPDLVATYLSSTRTPPGLLELELTESTLMEDAKRALEVLARLRALGIRLAVDDFGTGYSSLAYLHRLPLDVVKLDRSFITGLRTNRASAAIVGSTIALAHSLNFKVIAEGIEEPEILRDLKELQCDAAQGYFISRPLPLDRLQAWIELRQQPTSVSGIRRALGIEPGGDLLTTQRSADAD